MWEVFALPDSSICPQTAWAESRYSITKACQNKSIVSIETRPREAVSFVRHHRIGQSGEENPGLLQVTHVDFILKGEGMENEIGNRKMQARIREFILKTKSCYTLASGLMPVRVFTPFPPQVNLMFLTKNRFTRENPLQRLAGVCTWQPYITHLMSKWRV